MLFRVLAVSTVLLLSGCSKEQTSSEGDSSAEKKKESKSKPKASASAKPAPKPKRHELGPLPVTVELPPDAKIKEANDGGALIDVDGAGLNISTGTFADKKNTVKNFPFDKFNKWVKDEPNLAVAEMANGPNYRALRVFEVGGKKYVCSNVGVKGVATAELAEKIVARCETLKPKK